MRFYVIFVVVLFTVITQQAWAYHGERSNVKQDDRLAQPAETDDRSLDFVKMIKSFAQLTDTRLKRNIAPQLRSLAGTFEGTFFGALFSAMLNAIQNSSSNLENDIPEELKEPIPFAAFMSAVHELPMEMITASKPRLNSLVQMLGESEQSKVFQEIQSILDVRTAMLQMETTMSPNMFSSLSDIGVTDISQSQSMDLASDRGESKRKGTIGKIRDSKPGSIQPPINGRKVGSVTV